ncbi:MerR family transcriptional regulator [Aureibaculum sp. 2210JD6-5]|uniref:MerR family transcriptional regulator n=1 Tax=Aureibaculum sp. 2210JD6-5 TaxID=3103957 RepID=UPI002AAD1C0B|nr:MerR family transcriptional regulator [Aureibaculum sp. 2210JD6-5]MDY7394263.1 MerR family transcriptional regulator [Aureibaculum sp. 2210JD6-5]
MLNNIKTKFSIKDLENFTGIKPHTIRIWEKRYNLLEPSRTETNIRYYDEHNFIKLLNINLLYNNGYKISKIAKFSEDTLLLKAKEVVAEKAMEEGAINSFKLAMLNFNVVLFNDAYNKLLANKSFREIFLEVFIPLLDHIGFLWQSKSIRPIHEHFISNLIMQKLYTNIERNQVSNFTENDKTFVLFLPMNEIHELGLLFLHYELTLRGYHSIYLGQNIAIEAIEDLKLLYNNIHFISYFTVEPSENTIDDYLEKIHDDLIKNTNNNFWFLGKRAADYDKEIPYPKIQAISSLKKVLEII